MCVQLGAPEPGNENLQDGVKGILILVGKLMQLCSVAVSASMLKELTVWRHLHQVETLKQLRGYRPWVQTQPGGSEFSSESLFLSLWKQADMTDIQMQPCRMKKLFKLFKQGDHNLYRGSIITGEATAKTRWEMVHKQQEAPNAITQEL